VTDFGTDRSFLAIMPQKKEAVISFGWLKTF